MDIFNLMGTVRACSEEVYRTLGHGFLEIVYRNALVHELRSRNINVDTEKNLEVYYKGEQVGFYRPDIIVEDCLILELKSVSFITTKHSEQLVNYLVATNIDNGLLINFGNPNHLVVFHKTRVYTKNK